MIARYYEGTKRDSERWAALFDFMGNRLHAEEGKLSEELIERIEAYFEWRLSAGDATEIGRFNWWLKADSLDADWRLDAFERVLEVNPVDPTFLSWPVLEGLARTHTAKVLRCLEKMIVCVMPGEAGFHLGEMPLPISSGSLWVAPTRQFCGTRNSSARACWFEDVRNSWTWAREPENRRH